MMRTPSPPLHAGISVVLLLLVLGALYLLFVAPALASRTELRDREETLREQHAAFARAVADAARVEAEIGTLRAGGTDATGFFDDQPGALVAADLQRAVKEIVEEAGGTLVSTQVVPVTEKAVFPPVTVRMQLRADMQGMAQILYRLRTGEPLLFVDNLMIQPIRQAATRRGGQEGREAEVRLDVTGYIYRTGAS